MQKDIKRPKVDPTCEFCREINYDLQVEVVLDRFKRTTDVGNCVFACVDSIVTRKHIWDALQDKVNFFCDGRMSAEVLRVITTCRHVWWGSGSGLSSHQRQGRLYERN